MAHRNPATERAEASTSIAPADDINMSDAHQRMMVRYCELAHAGEERRAAWKDELDPLRADLCTYREIAKQFMDQHGLDRIVLPTDASSGEGQLVLKRRVSTSTRSITEHVMCSAWASAYRWERVAPLRGAPDGIAGAVIKLFVDDVRALINTSKTYADVVALNSPEDRSRCNVGGGPPRMSGDLRCPSALLQVCREIWLCKANMESITRAHREAMASIHTQCCEIEPQLHTALQGMPKPSVRICTSAADGPRRDVFLRRKPCRAKRRLTLKGLTGLAQRAVRALPPFAAAGQGDGSIVATGLPPVDFETIWPVLHQLVTEHTTMPDVHRLRVDQAPNRAQKRSRTQ